MSQKILRVLTGILVFFLATLLVLLIVLPSNADGWFGDPTLTPRPTLTPHPTSSFGHEEFCGMFRCTPDGQLATADWPNNDFCTPFVCTSDGQLATVVYTP